MENPDNIVPTNAIGNQLSLKLSKADEDRTKAAITFKRARMRLLNPSIWKDLCGTISATFEQFNEQGDKALRLTEEGDFIRVNIPGPGPMADHGYDWVKVERLVEHVNEDGGKESFAIQVRPSFDPSIKDGRITHFLTAHATSTFVIERDDATTTVFYFGRNEEINLHTDNVLDNIRNTAVALGSFAGMAKVQWEALLKGLLANEIGG